MKKVCASLGLVALIFTIGLSIQPKEAEAAPPYLCTNYINTPTMIGHGATCVDATQDLRVQLWDYVNTACDQAPFDGSCGSGLSIDVPCDYDAQMNVQVSGYMSYRCRFYPDR